MANPVYGDIDALGSAKFFIQFGMKQEANNILDMIFPYCTNMGQIDAIGMEYANNRNFLGALECAKKAIKLATSESQKNDCRINLIRSYLNSNMPNEALEHIDYVDTITHDNDPNNLDRAFAYFLLNRKDEAEAIIRGTLAKDIPLTTEVRNRCQFNLASYDLRNGDFKEGLKNFLIRGRTMDIWQEYTLNNRFWSGEDIPGATIVLMTEGGIGDEFINVRFMKHLKDRGMRGVWYTDRNDVADLFSRCGFETITDIADINPTWYWTYAMQMPVHLDVDESELWDGPFLEVKDKRDVIPKTIGLKISGNKNYDQDLARNIPLEDILAVIPEEYTVYSFQFDDPIDHPRLVNWMDADKTTWDDTLNKMGEMEFMISSCTSLIHAAGAIGKKSYVFTPILRYYPWGNDKSRSPWYDDNLTVLHQVTNNSWEEPVAVLGELINE